MAFLIGGANTLSTGDFITNSLRFNDDDSPSLSLDLSSPNTDKFTLSMWVKMTGARTQLGSLGKRLTGEAGDNRSIDIEQGSTGRLGISAYNGVADSNVAAYNSNNGAGPLLRDTSAWYNFVYAFDTGQGTAGDRLKWYINGVLQSGYNTTTTPSQNADLFDSSGSMIRIGKAINNESRFGDMYIAQYYYVDGQQYDHTYFGEFNDNGVWVPVEKGKGAGGAITFGTNGFYLEFKQTGTSANASGIGADTSGNGKHLTPANLAATDITTDTPINNFCTMNPLHNQHANSTFSEGNLQVATTVAQFTSNTGTMGVSSGKWYYECKNIGAGASNQHRFGFDAQMATGNNQSPGLLNPSIAYKFEGNYALNGSNVTDSDYSATSVGDIVGVAIDVDNNKFWVRNSSGYFDGDPAAGSGGIDISAPTANNGIGFYLPSYGDQHDGEGGFIGGFNFGNPFFAISSGNSDGNGYGNFEFAVPSGYYALCTKNLAEFG